MQKATVLLVEPGEGVRARIRPGLEEHGYVVEEAITAEGGLRHIRGRIPALLIAAYPLYLPSGDPFILAVRAISGKTSERLPIIALTRPEMTLDLMRAAAAGADWQCPRDMDSHVLVEMARHFTLDGP